MPIPQKSFPAIGATLVRGLLGQRVSWYTPEKYPRSLSDALRVYVEGKGILFVSYTHGTWNQLRMCFGRGSEFWSIDVKVSPDRSKYGDVEDLKDVLYDAMVKKFNRKIKWLGWAS
jgi:hypothetical protein